MAIVALPKKLSYTHNNCINIHEECLVIYIYPKILSLWLRRRGFSQIPTISSLDLKLNKATSNNGSDFGHLRAV
jgi:hypothetical protein